MKSNFIENRSILFIYSMTTWFVSKITVDPTQGAIGVACFNSVEPTQIWSRTILTMEMDKTHEIRDSVKRASTYPKR